jgi:hypothetical protein
MSKGQGTTTTTAEVAPTASTASTAASTASTVQAASGVTSERARRLVPGVAAGAVLIIGAGIVQGQLRDGFDMVNHPLSLLSNGGLGWVNIGNFVVSGTLMLLGAYGLRELLRGQPAGTWGPRLLGVAGISLIAGGVFVADPSFGFPEGAPPLEPDSLSWQGILHAIAPVTGGVAMVAALLVFARRWQGTGRRALALYGVVTAVIYALVASAPQGLKDDDGYYNFVPLWVAGVVSAAWAVVLVTSILAETSPRRATPA